MTFGEYSQATAGQGDLVGFTVGRLARAAARILLYVAGLDRPGAAQLV